MIQKYYLLFRNTPLVILARSEEEALEPWRRVNLKQISLDEFRSNLIQDASFSPVLMLAGRSVTRNEIESIYRPRKSASTTEKKAIESPKPAKDTQEAPQVKRGRGRPRKNVSTLVPDATVEVMADVISEVGPDLAEMAISKMLKPAESVSESSAVGEILSNVGEVLSDMVSGLADFIQLD